MKIFFGLGLVLLIAAMSTLFIDFGEFHGMGMSHRRGMGPMMGGGRNLGKNPVKPTAESIARGRRLYQANCQVCHGPGGRGDGPAAAGLNPRPADLKQSAIRLRDGVLAGVITDGRGTMPSYKAILTPSQIWNLTNFVKSLTR